MDRLIKPAIGAIACLIIGFTSSFSTFGVIESWYPTLNKPAFNPPNWIFGPMWSLLYLMMGAAAGFIWNLGLKHSGVKMALLVFVLQLILNYSWTPMFFGQREVFLALLIIGALLPSILLCMIIFFKLQRLAGWLLVPYLLWVSFATLLNYSIWKLNP